MDEVACWEAGRGYMGMASFVYDSWIVELITIGRKTTARPRPLENRVGNSRITNHDNEEEEL